MAILNRRFRFDLTSASNPRNSLEWRRVLWRDLVRWRYVVFVTSPLLASSRV